MRLRIGTVEMELDDDIAAAMVDQQRADKHELQRVAATIDHLARFNRLYDQLVTNTVAEEFLRECEWRDNLFPNVNWRYYV